MTLEELIDFDQLEQLVEQHHSYQWKGCHCTRDAGWCEWYVYYGGKSIQTYRNPPETPKGYNYLADALDAAYEFNRMAEDGEIQV